MADLVKYPYLDLTLRDLEGEVWKQVPGMEDYYMVSNLGRIKSLERKITAFNISTYSYTNPEKILKQRLKCSKTGLTHRLRSTLTIEKRSFNICMPNLVYCVFHGSFDKKKMVVRFKDNDSLNNRADNLFLMTRSESVKNYVRQGIMFPSKKRRRIPVEQYTLDGTYIDTYTSIEEAYRKTGVSQKGIRTVINGIYRKAGGYYWKYHKEDIKLANNTRIIKK